MACDSCRTCNYCKDHRRYGNTRGSYFCEHPDQKYIVDYFKENRINRSTGFIDFGESGKDVPKLKTRPKWCPERRWE